MKKIVWSLLLFIGLFCACTGTKTTAPDSSEQTNVQEPFDSSAQIGEYVVSLFEDKDSVLWFGTMNGVVRFDGKSLVRYTMAEGLPDNAITGIEQDASGNMWFGTHNGAARFDGKSFAVFGESKGLHGAGCKLLFDKDGKLWAGTNHGVFQFNGFSFAPFDLPKPDIENVSAKWEAGKVWNIMQDSKGNIWFGRDGYGACKFDGTNFTHYLKKDGLCSNNVSRIIEDKSGNIWFGCLGSDQPKVIEEGGLVKYDGKSFTQFSDIPALTMTDIYTVYAERSGKVWIGATHNHAYRYNPDTADGTGGTHFTIFADSDRKDLLKYFGMQAVLEDSKGNLWFGFSGGLFRFDGKRFVNITQGGLFE